MRDIADILAARKDLSPFLVHLTKPVGDASAEQNLRSILDSSTIDVGTSSLGSFKFVRAWPNLDTRVADRLRAVCFSETPIDEIHCLLDIRGRAINLSQYGVILIKELLLEENRISPVLYINTFSQNHKTAYAEFINQMYDRAVGSGHLEMMDFMVYFESFGEQLRGTGEANFYWEREWRCRDAVNFEEDQIFLGLCPHEQIATFEHDYPNIKFIDPKMNPRYYSNKIIARKQELELKSNLL